MTIFTIFYFDGQAVNTVSVHGLECCIPDNDFIEFWTNRIEYGCLPCGYAVYEDEFGIIFKYKIIANRAPDYFNFNYIAERIDKMIY